MQTFIKKCMPLVGGMTVKQVVVSMVVALLVLIIGYFILDVQRIPAETYFSFIAFCLSLTIIMDRYSTTSKKGKEFFTLSRNFLLSSILFFLSFLSLQLIEAGFSYLLIPTFLLMLFGLMFFSGNMISLLYYLLTRINE